MARLAGWSVRHRAMAIGGWFALVLVAMIGGTLLGSGSVNTLDAGESGRADRVINKQTEYVPAQENVLVTGSMPGQKLVDDTAARRAIDDLDEALTTSGAVAVVRSPLAPGNQDLISRDGTAGLLTFQIVGVDDVYVKNYDTAAADVQAVAARYPGVRLDQAGDRSLSLAVDDSINDDFDKAGIISLPLALIILQIVFGSLIAAGIPLLLAGTAVLATFGFLQVIDNVVPVNSATSAMILLIGMAVGIDYSLFYLRREREERHAGRSVPEALRITAGTSGRVVMVSGVTVMLCVCGLLFTGLDVFKGLTAGAVLVVGFAMLGSVTVLPALMAVIGSWVDRTRIPWLGRRRTNASPSRLWNAVAEVVVRRPVLWGGLAALALLLAALPALGMHLQDPARTESLPRSNPTIDSALRMQQEFPGASAPAWVVVWRTDGAQVDTPEFRAAVARLHGQVAGSSGVIAEPISVDKVDRIAVVRVPLAGAGTDRVSDNALLKLRNQILPATMGGLAGVQYAVAGRTAVAYDFARQLANHAVWVYVFVLLLAFVLLLVVFRSLALPLVSIALNLLSIIAAYGALTWVFQDGHFEDLLGFTAYGGVVGWLPLFMFVLLFGLSMDYHIFILSRIRERRAAGLPARESIISGIGTSAGVVTSAAMIMVAVFSVFVTLTAIEYKMLGIGMAAAVLIDATLVRGVLLPAALALLGRHAWTLPSWLA